nr:DUF983 domain-containing protein [Brevundimonas lutea]
MTEASDLSPLIAGLRGRCPACGRGALFAGFLKPRDRCETCGYDLASANTGDGAATFIMLIGGGLVAFLALFAEIAWRPPIWLHLTLWVPLAGAVCLGLMRPSKGLMIGLEVRNRAREVRNDDF